ncbi:unnamed protein product [Miscanthus lutarioriparius]|uniref:DUF4218 domain-containing protein n=1 Tax=Miscanthus lutarioriparius TaxID=422564 RepID=A0A811R3K5_9POAL|nr:unnamed protein product [Miscanthus lutarioriparius]
MARPEGSIAEAYVATECLNICSRYFGDDVETRHNQEGRNRERIDMRKCDISVFKHGVEVLGAPTITYLERDYEKMVWFVLNNYKEKRKLNKMNQVTRTMKLDGNMSVKMNFQQTLPKMMTKIAITSNQCKSKGPDLSKSLPSTGGSRASKRVMALQEQDQPARMTRQRTKEKSSADEFCPVPTTDPQDAPTEDGLIALDAHTQSYNHNNMTVQGK